MGLLPEKMADEFDAFLVLFDGFCPWLAVLCVCAPAFMQFVQLLKQLTRNPSLHSCLRGWQLLCVIFITGFPPSGELLWPLHSWIESNQDSKISYDHAPSGRMIGAESPSGNGRNSESSNDANQEDTCTLLRTVVSASSSYLTVVSHRGAQLAGPDASAIAAALEAPLIPSIFGLPLSRAMEVQRTTYPEFEIPVLLYFCADAMQVLDAPRVAGVWDRAAKGVNAVPVQNLAAEIDRGMYNWKGCSPESTLPAALLLKYFSMMVPSLLSECSRHLLTEFHMMTQATSAESEETRNDLCPAPGFALQVGTGRSSEAGGRCGVGCSLGGQGLQNCETARLARILNTAVPPLPRRVLLFLISFLQLFVVPPFGFPSATTPAHLANIFAPVLFGLSVCSDASTACGTPLPHGRLHSSWARSLQVKLLTDCLVHLDCKNVDPEFRPHHEHVSRSKLHVENKSGPQSSHSGDGAQHTVESLLAVPRTESLHPDRLDSVLPRWSTHNPHGARHALDLDSNKALQPMTPTLLVESATSEGET